MDFHALYTDQKYTSTDSQTVCSLFIFDILTPEKVCSDIKSIYRYYIVLMQCTVTACNSVTL